MFWPILIYSIGFVLFWSYWFTQMNSKPRRADAIVDSTIVAFAWPVMVALKILFGIFGR